MEASALRRVGLAATVALAGAVAIAVVLAVSSVQADSADLKPDLVTLAIQQEDVLIQVDGDRTLLRFTNEIGNRGNGPLEVYPSAQSGNCDGDGDPSNDRDASQRVFADSNGDGAFERDADAVAYERKFGCMRFHAAHNHWHVLDISSYELRREPGGDVGSSRVDLQACKLEYSIVSPK